jgi:hypothetical protein
VPPPWGPARQPRRLPRSKPYCPEPPPPTLTVACHHCCYAPPLPPSRRGHPRENRNKGKGENRVTHSRSRAPRRRVAFAGPPPSCLSAVRRPAPSSPPLELTVAFAVQFWSSWCKSRDEWSSRAPYLRCTAARRRVPPLAAGIRLHPRVRCIGAAGSPVDGPDQFDLGSNRSVPVNRYPRARIRSQPPDLDPTDQIRSLRLNRAVLLKIPLVFPILQKYPSTLRFSRG